jgi:hypothetical protein
VDGLDDSLSQEDNWIYEIVRDVCPKLIDDFSETPRLILEQFLDEVSVELSRECELSMHRQRTKHANFLKHADRDSNALLQLSELKNDRQIASCMALYHHIPRDYPYEFLAFAAYSNFSGSNPCIEVEPGTEMEGLANLLRRLSKPVAFQAIYLTLGGPDYLEAVVGAIKGFAAYRS